MPNVAQITFIPFPFHSFRLEPSPSLTLLFLSLFFFAFSLRSFLSFSFFCFIVARFWIPPPPSLSIFKRTEQSRSFGDHTQIAILAPLSFCLCKFILSCRYQQVHIPGCPDQIHLPFQLLLFVLVCFTFPSPPHICTPIPLFVCSVQSSN